MVEQACGWEGSPGILFQALLKCRFIEEIPQGVRIHNWAVYNGKHIEKAMNDAARKREQRAVAVAARAVGGDGAGKSEKEMKSETETETNTKKENQTETETAHERQSRPEDLQQLWNSLKAPEQPAWKEMTPDRKKKAAARLRGRPLHGDGSWEEVIKRIAKSSFARGLVPGRDGRTWIAGPQFILGADSAPKVLEGTYDDKPSNGISTGRIRAEDVPSEAFARTGDVTNEF
jgi:hypothetical protein